MKRWGVCINGPVMLIIVSKYKVDLSFVSGRLFTIIISNMHQYVREAFCHLLQQTFLNSYIGKRVTVMWFQCLTQSRNDRDRIYLIFQFLFKINPYILRFYHFAFYSLESESHSALSQFKLKQTCFHTLCVVLVLSEPHSVLLEHMDSQIAYAESLWSSKTTHPFDIASSQCSNITEHLNFHLIRFLPHSFWTLMQTLAALVSLLQTYRKWSLQSAFNIIIHIFFCKYINTK